MEGLIGFFVNTLALRVAVAGEPSVAELLGQVKERDAGRVCAPGGAVRAGGGGAAAAAQLSHSPVFQVMVVLQNAPRRVAASCPELSVAGQELQQQTAQFDLTLSLQEDGGADRRAALNYASDLFERATIERWIGYYTAVLEAMVADAQQRLSEIDAAECGRAACRCCEEFNATQAEYPQAVADPRAVRSSRCRRHPMRWRWCSKTSS